MSSFEGFQAELDQLKAAGLLRKAQQVEAVDRGRIKIDGRWLIHLSSNSSLGLHLHPKVRQAAVEAIHAFGTGSGSARLLGGSLPVHEALEEALADFKGTEAALLFSTGYMANLGIITALVGKGDCVVVDHLSHASLIDACRLSGATLRVYPHKNVEQLKATLQFRPGRFGKVLVITEGLFSMDGDIAPLPEILEVVEQAGAWLLVDDAHATGVLGEGGRGTVEHFGLMDRVKTAPVLQMGTLSKAIGSLGGFLAGPRVIIETARNRARSFIYTTALAPASAAAALKALQVIQAEPEIRKTLWKNIQHWIQCLEHSGVKLVSRESHIVPFQSDFGTAAAGTPQSATGLAQALLDRGVFAPGVRPPTVPAGSARIRTAVTALHDEAVLDQAAIALNEALQETALV